MGSQESGQIRPEPERRRRGRKKRRRRKRRRKERAVLSKRKDEEQREGRERERKSLMRGGGGSGVGGIFQSKCFTLGKRKVDRNHLLVPFYRRQIDELHRLHTSTETIQDKTPSQNLQNTVVVQDFRVSVCWTGGTWSRWF